MANARLFETDYSKTWPESLRQAAANGPVDDSTWQPIIIRMDQAESDRALDTLLASHDVRRVNDNYDDQIGELVISRNPQLYRANIDIKRSSVADYLREHYAGKPTWTMGSWVFFPWSGELVHVLAEDLFQELRTIRNRDLIEADEQKAFADIQAGCLGMSVGSSAAAALVLGGGSMKLKIADSAVISGSNLNRIRTGIHSVGMDKSIVVARQLYEMNPYLTLERFTSSITADTLSAFFEQPWPLDVVVDEIDDLELKIRLRVEARRRRIPVVMATDLGDDVMLDVERFDLDGNLPLFHGLAGVIEDVLSRPNMTQREWLKYATLIIGTKNVPLRMQQSLLKIGTKLVTQPQLGGTAMMAGGVVAYAVRHLALGGSFKSPRMIVSLDATLLDGHSGFRHRRRHARHTKLLDRSMKSM